MDGFLQDLFYAFRLLRKNPSFTIVAVLTLALGIGANTAVFSVAYPVLLGPLPYRQPEQLALIWSDFQKMGAARAPASGVQLREIRDRSRLFRDVSGIWVGNGTLTGEREPEQIKLGFVTHNFFSVLGVTPMLGRSFTPEDEGRANSVPMILSYGLWQRRYGSDPGVIGRQIRLEGNSATVVGVMAPDFHLLFSPDANVPRDTQAWIPFPYDIYALPTDLYYIRLVGRLGPGATLEQAQQEMDAVARQLRSQHSEFASENLRLELAPIRGDAVREIRPALLALLAGTGFVLLIACVNVANLLLTRAHGRRREIAVRAALGASRWRIARLLLAESLLLGSLGGAGGLGLGYWGISILLAIQPEGLTRLESVEPNLPVLLFVTAVSLLSGLLFGLAPLLESGKVRLTESLKEAGRGATGGGKQRTRALLVISEIALGFVLVVGAGLMLRTLAQLHRVNPGFDPDRVLTFELNLSGKNYAADSSRAEFVRQWEAALSALPGVESLGGVSHLPLDDYPNWYSPYFPEGMSEGEKSLLADYRAVTAGYFHAMGGSLVSGRYFDQHDSASGRKVVIVDDLLAAQTWPGKNAVGQRLRAEHFVEGGFEYDWAEVVGVVRHIRHHSLASELRGQIYIPYPQSARPHLSYAVRARGDALALVGPIRNQLAGLDKELALSKVRPMRDFVEKSLAPASFTALLAGIFGGLALLLAAVGIYGVISYSTSQRTQEIGLRLALGASPRDILSLILGEGLVLTGCGLLLGIFAALALSRFLRSLLFGVSTLDPATYLAALLVIAVVGLLAAWRPSRVAADSNPLEILRAQS